MIVGGAGRQRESSILLCKSASSKRGGLVVAKGGWSGHVEGSDASLAQGTMVEDELGDQILQRHRDGSVPQHRRSLSLEGVVAVPARPWVDVGGCAMDGCACVPWCGGVFVSGGRGGVEGVVVLVPQPSWLCRGAASAMGCWLVGLEVG